MDQTGYTTRSQHRTHQTTSSNDGRVLSHTNKLLTAASCPFQFAFRPHHFTTDITLYYKSTISHSSQFSGSLWMLSVRLEATRLRASWRIAATSTRTSRHGWSTSSSLPWWHIISIEPWWWHPPCTCFPRAKIIKRRRCSSCKCIVRIAAAWHRCPTYNK